ncbi:uncharacterized protein G2W53_034538 [Senna tora]|uniref:Uncharacterized protein n=1 Tax=Senna tora TaxID=362788 RepID=A0A834W903_9FABA|nr:uncharacterized protein G2W53_034538 [Senna tora]
MTSVSAYGKPPREVSLSLLAPGRRYVYYFR